MAIVKMKKFNLFALEGNRKQLLEELQKFGYVNFVKTNPKGYEDYVKDAKVSTCDNPYAEDCTKLQWMIEYVEKFSVKEKGLANLKKEPKVYDFAELEEASSGYSYADDFSALTEMNKKLEENRQEIFNLNNSIKDLTPWRSIQEPIKELTSFRKSKFIMGSIPVKNLEKLKNALVDLSSTYFEEVEIVGNIAYCIIFTNFEEAEMLMEKLRHSGFGEISLNVEGVVNDEIIKINEKMDILKNDNDELMLKIKNYVDKLPQMKVLYEYYQNLALRNSVVSNFKSTDKLDVIQGFIPFDKETEFKATLERVSSTKLHLEIEEADAEDPEVPIILKNNKISSLFESVTKMYALPKYNEVDPTFMLSIFYWIFFGMMVADFAYGLILFVGSAIALKTLKFNESTKKFIKFFFSLSFSTMIWGLIYGSAFGDLIKLPTQILDSQKDFMTVLMLSLAFGGVHLAFGLGLKAYVLIKNGKPMDAVYDVFLWYLTLVSVIVFIMGKAITMPEIVNTISFYGMIVGMLGIIAFGARDSKSIAGRIAGGLYSLYGITSYIGDFVSYLRLMALGLAGGFIAVAINIIVKMLAGSGIIGLIIGIVIFTFAQAFNIFLSFLSAYVHTSRLMYVEFFSKFYEGGGKAFKNFRSENKYLEVK
ncbi:MAG: V-type ATP synthase subunit I [Peptoniphilaceae bacterium]|uniref:V-type ATP synthase subunit I n=1 Tax=Parvimonas sp. TaxID=1944660 RepID=UPI002A7581F6|nr:V-type ATP synthase subunit I [Parvimonas sp.]MDD7764292.1 V-type ATP synthase subunit I [Peptoniphilaceae bacterium]MDY3051555.1 V-type ATP synthase subunit I [Parvimonas sp.]